MYSSRRVRPLAKRLRARATSGASVYSLTAPQEAPSCSSSQLRSLTKSKYEETKTSCPAHDQEQTETQNNESTVYALTRQDCRSYCHCSDHTPERSVRPWELLKLAKSWQDLKPVQQPSVSTCQAAEIHQAFLMPATSLPELGASHSTEQSRAITKTAWYFC